MSKKLTPWFPRHAKPRRKGWYEVKGTNIGVTACCGSFRYWTGVAWTVRPADNSWSFISSFGDHPSHAWRGLAKKPATKDAA